MIEELLSKPTELIMDALQIKDLIMQCKTVIKPSHSVQLEVIIKMSLLKERSRNSP